MITLLVLALASIVTIAGDYFVKLASQDPKGISTFYFALGALLYGLPAFAWFYLMRQHSLAAVGVMYSSATIVLLTLLGVFVFKESFGWRDGLGVGLAIAAVVVSLRPE